MEICRVRATALDRAIADAGGPPAGTTATGVQIFAPWNQPIADRYVVAFGCPQAALDNAAETIWSMTVALQGIDARASRGDGETSTWGQARIGTAMRVVEMAMAAAGGLKGAGKVAWAIEPVLGGGLRISERCSADTVAVVSPDSRWSWDAVRVAATIAVLPCLAGNRPAHLIRPAWDIAVAEAERALGWASSTGRWDFAGQDTSVVRLGRAQLQALARGSEGLRSRRSAPVISVSAATACGREVWLHSVRQADGSHQVLLTLATREGLHLAETRIDLQRLVCGVHEVTHAATTARMIVLPAAAEQGSDAVPLRQALAISGGLVTVSESGSPGEVRVTASLIGFDRPVFEDVISRDQLGDALGPAVYRRYLDRGSNPAEMALNGPEVALMRGFVADAIDRASACLGADSVASVARSAAPSM